MILCWPVKQDQTILRILEFSCIKVKFSCIKVSISCLYYPEDKVDLQYNLSHDKNNNIYVGKKGE